MIGYKCKANSSQFFMASVAIASCELCFRIENYQLSIFVSSRYITVYRFALQRWLQTNKRCFLAYVIK
jgi:hypothetical protein